MSPEIRIETGRETDLEDLAALRALLWPDDAEADHRDDARKALHHPDIETFVARGPDGALLAFAEASIRRDPVNGCATSPVGFLEGIYVRAGARHQGLARALAQAVEEWTRARGCRELASDAWLGDVRSHAMHEALGFTETERVVCFRKILA